MPAPAENQFWKQRSTHGRAKIFETPEDMWEAACEYFKWTEEHPLYETKVFCNQGVIKKTKVPIMRAMTISALCLFWDVSGSYLTSFRSRCKSGDLKNGEDFLVVLNLIDNVIYNQKFQGAAGNLLNANIIARDLKLKDVSDITSAGNAIDGKVVIQLIDSRNQVIKELDQNEEQRALDLHEDIEDARIIDDEE